MKIDHLKAERILREIVCKIQLGHSPKSNFSTEIKTIILGTHKTYRYIFTNALLAKSTEV